MSVRTRSSDSTVGPAVTNRDRPHQSRRSGSDAPARLNTLAAARMIRSGSAIRPGPIRSQASSPEPGDRPRTFGQVSTVSQFRRTAGWAHMAVFIAAAASTGASVANSRLASRPSAIPAHHRPRLVALKGAMITSSAHSASSMCNGRGQEGDHSSPSWWQTWRLKLANATGLTNRAALGVTTQRTSAPA